MDTPISQSILHERYPTVYIYVKDRCAEKVGGYVKFNSQHEPFTSSMTYNELEKKGEEIRTELGDVVFEFAHAMPNGNDVAEARMRYSKVLGRELAKNLFGGEQIPKKISAAIEGLARPRIEVMSENFSLPWDMLRTRDSEDTFHQFWGARAVINHSICPRKSHDNEMWYDKLPCVGLIADNSLEYVSNEEVPYFSGLESTGRIKLRTWSSVPGGWGQNDDRFKKFWNEGSPINIGHFACHATTEEDRRFLIVDGSLKITTDELCDTYSDEFIAHHPLIVLNACRTGQSIALSNLAFVKTFVDVGARGVIGTECEIPDNLAHVFCKGFYKRFLPQKLPTNRRAQRVRYTRGANLGNSLFNTRIELWEKFRNPIGLLYSLYAPPGFSLVSKA